MPSAEPGTVPAGGGGRPDVSSPEPVARAGTGAVLRPRFAGAETEAQGRRKQQQEQWTGQPLCLFVTFRPPPTPTPQGTAFKESGLSPFKVGGPEA